MQQSQLVVFASGPLSSLNDPQLAGSDMGDKARHLNGSTMVDSDAKKILLWKIGCRGELFDNSM